MPSGNEDVIDIAWNDDSRLTVDIYNGNRLERNETERGDDNAEWLGWNVVEWELCNSLVSSFSCGADQRVHKKSWLGIRFKAGFLAEIINQLFPRGLEYCQMKKQASSRDKILVAHPKRGPPKRRTALQSKQSLEEKATQTIRNVFSVPS